MMSTEDHRHIVERLTPSAASTVLLILQVHLIVVFVFIIIWDGGKACWGLLSTGTNASSLRWGRVLLVPCILALAGYTCIRAFLARAFNSLPSVAACLKPVEEQPVLPGRHLRKIAFPGLECIP
jgi:hypothetical protein